MSQQIVWFDDVLCRDDSVVGNKAAGLARLVAQTCTVPRGFVVPHSFTLDGTGLQQLQSALTKLTGPYAVRSSSSAEDSATQAFPGMFSSKLNCATSQAVIKAIKEVRADIQLPRVSAYMRKHNLSDTTVNMSVIVQTMVPAIAAGVAFSHDPTSGHRMTVIESTWGLGESLVSGAVTPDRFEVSAEGSIRYKRLGSKGANPIVTTEQADRTIFSLHDVQAVTLSTIVQAIAAAAGVAQDVEWALRDNQFYILQARPLTAIPAAPRRPAPDQAALLLEQIRASTHVAWQFYVSRVFNWLIEDIQLQCIQPQTQEQTLGFSAPIGNYLILNGDEYGSAADTQAYATWLGRSLRHDPDFFAHFADVEESLAVEAHTLAQTMGTRDYGGLSNSRLASEIRAFQANYLRSFVPTWVRPDDFLEHEVRQRLAKESPAADVDELFKTLASAGDLQRIVYAEEPLALLRIAQRASRGEDIAAALRTHTAAYAWTKDCLSSNIVRFSEADYQTRVDHLLKTGGIDEKIAAITELRAHARRSYEQLLADESLQATTTRLLTATARFIFLRTFTTQHSDHLFFVAKTTLLSEVARRLDWPLEKVCMLTLSETAGLLQQPESKRDYETLISDRQAGFALTFIQGTLQTVFGAPAAQLAHTAGQTLRTSTAPAAAQNQIVHGSCANPGTITGIVHVLTDPSTVTDFQPGEILVSSMTTPEYVAAMEKAAAFVTDEGGITCHAAITAREFGVPCITGTGNATKVLRTGDRVKVNAARGTIELLASTQY